MAWGWENPAIQLSLRQGCERAEQQKACAPAPEGMPHIPCNRSTEHCLWPSTAILSWFSPASSRQNRTPTHLQQHPTSPKAPPHVGGAARPAPQVEVDAGIIEELVGVQPRQV